MNFEPGEAEDKNFNGILDTGEDVNSNLMMDGLTITWREDGISDAYAEWIPSEQRLEFDGKRDWFFGGVGLIPMNQVDFFTIALHELGHVIGLNHINSGKLGMLMRSDIGVQATAAGTNGLRVPDAGSLEGAVALYTQPVPAPLPILGIGVAFGYVKRLKKLSTIISSTKK